MTNKVANDKGIGGAAWTGILVSTVISSLSLLVSALALWNSGFSPAEIKVSVDHPVFQLQNNPAPPPIAGATPHTSILIFAATCSFANNGANIGEISQLGLQFKSDDGTEWVFHPYLLADDWKPIKNGSEPGRIDLQSAPRFRSILIPGKGTAVHTYLFFPDIGGDFDFVPHNFRVTLLSWSAGELMPHKQQVSTLDLNALVINTIRGGEFIGVPFEETRQQLNTPLR